MVHLCYLLQLLLFIMGFTINIELLGEKHYLPEIPMLKDREKLIEQDTIWKKICEELNWEYITTI